MSILSHQIVVQVKLKKVRYRTSLYLCYGLAALVTLAAESAEKVLAEYDEQNHKRTNINSECSTLENNQKQDDNPHDVTACVCAVFAATASSKQISKHF